MSARAGVIVTAALLLVARAALHAQQTDARADSLLRDGAIGRAESLYYAAVRVRPRDPEARWALGRYLISRGAVRVGATLVEEAVRFGLDPAVGAATLAPAYLQIGEYHALAALPSTTLSAGEVARARWLVEHPSRIVAPDSIIVVDYRPSAGDGAIGTIPIRVNGRTVKLIRDFVFFGQGRYEHSLVVDAPTFQVAQLASFETTIARILVKRSTNGVA